MEPDDRPTPILGIDYGRYRVLRVLGSGSFGTVYEAVQQPLGRRVALKVMHPHLAVHPEAVARFEQEARTAAAVRHPHVVEVHDLGRQGKVPYLAMELLEGETLHDAFTRERTLPVPVLADLVLPVLAALSVMHARGVVHQDMKPENVFLSVAPGSRLVPKVLDLGVARFRAVDEDFPGRRPRVGTPEYMSPEQVRGDTVDARTDLWAVGVMLYEGSTGVMPFQGPDVDGVFDAILTARLKPPRMLKPSLPEAFELVVCRALERSPGERFHRAVEMARSLVAFAGEEGQRVWVEEFGQTLPTSSKTPAPVSTPPGPRRSQPPRIANDPRVYLKSVDTFARLTPEDADALLSCVRWRALAMGDVLFREGSAGVTMAFVVEGALSVCTESGGARTELSRVGIGRFVGEMACLDPSPRSATVVAATPCVVGEISRESLRTLREVAPRAASALTGHILRQVVRRLREVEERIDAALAPTSEGAEGEGEAPGEEGGVRKLIDWLRGLR